jgi:hypothetical protein
VEEPSAWQEVAAGLAARGMSGTWPAVPVLEQAECWLAGLPSWTSVGGDAGGGAALPA